VSGTSLEGKRVCEEDLGAEDEGEDVVVQKACQEESMVGFQIKLDGPQNLQVFKESIHIILELFRWT
jgi:hypothetical protein